MFGVYRRWFEYQNNYHYEIHYYFITLYPFIFTISNIINKQYPVKLGRCIKELERIYDIKQGVLVFMETNTQKI